VNTSAAALPLAERIELQRMIDSPDLVEYHGTDMAWQTALSGALLKPSLLDSLNFDPPATGDSDAPSQR